MPASNFYCSQKFWWLSIDIEKFQTLSCCAAAPQKIKFDWLKHNPGDIFNTPELQQERKMMLDNQPVDSCKATCWSAEERGESSRRLIMHSDKQTHSSLCADPETLNIIVGSHCNLTCVYCCKQYSSAWATDIFNNGTYDVATTDDRFVINTTDRLIRKLSQREIGLSESSQLLLQQIQAISVGKNPPKTIVVTGGEPFLYNGLSDLISVLPDHVTIKIWSGLGVDETRFSRELDKILSIKNIEKVISAENINEQYEFSRYGNSWARFERNLQQLESQGVNYQFNATVSNLTVFGLNQFEDYFAGKTINYQLVTDPDFLSIAVLDNQSKDWLQKHSRHQFVTDTLHLVPTVQQRQNLKNYLLEFARRRAINLDIFPRSFVKWIQNE